MATLITLGFQGKVTATGGLSADEEREAAHAAFPLSPARDSTVHEDFRAWKIAPLSSGRALVSTVMNRGDVDEYDRPVLRAVGCVLETREMLGPWRDLAAVWEALGEEGLELDAGSEALEQRVGELSIHTSTESFARFRSELEHSGPFHARVAAALREETADLYFGVTQPPEPLRYGLGLLPIASLQRLHLAIGCELTDYREPAIGLAGLAPDSWQGGGVLSSLFGRKDDDRSAAAVDFEQREAFGFRSKGPRAVADAIVDARPWPAGIDEHERYRILLQCLDAREAGEARSPFDAVPELEAMRQAVGRLEELSSELSKWP